MRIEAPLLGPVVLHHQLGIGRLEFCDSRGGDFGQPQAHFAERFDGGELLKPVIGDVGFVEAEGGEFGELPELGEAGVVNGGVVEIQKLQLVEAGQQLESIAGNGGIPQMEPC